MGVDLEALMNRAPADPLLVHTAGSDPVFIMYTSGTTGLPKGVIHTNDSLQWAVLTTPLITVVLPTCAGAGRCPA